MSPSRSRRRRPRKKKNNKKILLAVALLAVVAVIIVGYNMVANNSNSGDNLPATNKVMLVTSMGNITIQLRDDMPITTSNFKNLVQQGIYDNTIFHRMIADFMIQGGDPATGTWSGGSIANIKDEFSEKAENNKNERGTLAMAKQSDLTTGQVIPESGSSQFFINVVYNSYLDNTYSVFGEVIDGMDVVDAISNVATDTNHRPLEGVVLIGAYFVD
jgi:peptidylprolyl isomerase